MNPKVSFVVPCYNLGHLLPDCVHSILNQSYKNLELIIMDDCSPDATPEIAKTFKDSRVAYFRNETNLGVCGNFNRGIELAQGEYIWIISADDRLRRNYAVEKFVALMESDPGLGFAFCPVVLLERGQETTSPNKHGQEDRIFKGHDFFRMLQKGYCLSASAIVRRECYHRLGMLPVDLDYGGDWYVWCLFSLYYDVGYLAEPMVNYRVHDQQITKVMAREVPQDCRDMYIAARWRVKARAESEGHEALAAACLDGIVTDYKNRLTSRLRHSGTLGLTLEEFEMSLARHGANNEEVRRLRAYMYNEAGDTYHCLNDFQRASECYAVALGQRWDVRGLAKYALLKMGWPGIRLRRWLAAWS